MIVQAIAFYVFAAVAVLSATMVVASRNPVYSVLFLILTFFNAAGLFVLIGAEFLAMMLVVVYVGAVAVLFLFVVMMLDINFVELRQGFVRYLPIGAAVAFVLVAELVIVFGSSVLSAGSPGAIGAPTPALEQVTNTAALGNIMYTQYFYLFQAAGMVLLVAMIGAIVLTHRERAGVMRQKISTQLERGRDSVVLTKVKTGSGV
jgi:NADH-quinone oxidoreductase subunit J